MSVLITIYIVLMLVFLLLFIIDGIRARTHITQYARLGLFLGLVSLLFELATLGLLGDSLSLYAEQFVILSVGEVFLVIKTALFAAMGIYCCSSLGYPSAPLLLRVIRPTVNKRQSNQFDPLAIEQELTPDHGNEPARDTEDQSINWWAGVAWAMVIAAVGTVFSGLLLNWISPQLSESLRQLMEYSQEGMAQQGITNEPTLLAAVVVCAFAFGEEVIFRLGIQNFLAKNLNLRDSRYWIAIVITTGIWALAHANMLDPEWVKLVQVFPIGLALGFLFRKYGLEICILTHMTFNLVMMFVGPRVIQM